MNQNQILENGPETITEDKEVHPTIVANEPEIPEPESHPFIINEKPHAATVEVESNPNNDFQLFDKPETDNSMDSFITKITDYANKHPDLSPIEDGSIPTPSTNNEQKPMPKSERTDNGWKISFE